MTSKPLFSEYTELTADLPFKAFPKEDSALLPKSDEPMSVTEVSLAVKGLVEKKFDSVKVRGEISGFKKAASGHMYFALKDEESVLDGVCWRGSASKLSVTPQDGLEVVCTGRITTYPGRSKYQMVVETMEAAGEGALLKILEELKKKLEAEGLFAPERKKKIPFLPDVIGVVTSPTGAVIRDIMHRLNDRFPRRVLLWPCTVQGDGAAEQIAAAIKGFNAIPKGGLTTPDGTVIPRPDVLIVARGGGSLEDLWAFNQEIVVRAAAQSEIPLISAVGHETDTTLIDYASDLRAPTPTGAAEKAVPVKEELENELNSKTKRMAVAVSRLCNEQQNIITGLVRGLPPLEQIIAEHEQKIDDRTERLNNAILTAVGIKTADLERCKNRLAKPDLMLSNAKNALLQLKQPMENAVKNLLIHSQNSLETAERLLESCSYERVLERGFALVLDSASRPVSCAADAAKKSNLNLKFADGTVSVTTSLSPKKTHSPKRTDDGQQEMLL